VRAIDYGGFRARPGDAVAGPWDEEPIDASACQPPKCSEPIALEVAPLPSRGCPSGMLPDGSCVNAPKSLRESTALATLRDANTGTHECPHPSVVAPGQRTEQAAQAHRLFGSGRWAEAAMSAARIARNETGDDEGNRWVAEYMLAVSWERLHHEVEATALLSRIALMPCHPMHDEASYWMTIVERRVLR
jgi:hypothetical protein